MIQPNGTIGRSIWGAVMLATCSVHAESYRGLNPGVVQLRDIRHDAKAGTITLSWTSEPGKRYVIEETTNPQLGWEANLSEVGGISRSPQMTVLPLPGNLGAKTLLFRVREMAPKSEDAKPSSESSNGSKGDSKEEVVASLTDAKQRLRNRSGVRASGEKAPAALAGIGIT